ncbi:MAG: DUF4114 domain-containing protein [Polyangia bacterium]
MSRLAPSLFLVATLSLPSLSLALTQPNGTPIPSPLGCASGQPTGLAAVFACQCTALGMCNIGAPCPGGSTTCDDGKKGTCETTLWHSVNDNSCVPSNLSGINPATDAHLTPETFHPTCALTFTVVTRGSARFHTAFGWYNVGAGAPDPSDLHVMLDCNAAPATAVVLDVRNDPAYKGGDIGFFLVTPEDHATTGACAGGDCCATVPRAAGGAGYIYYSQRALNPDGGGANAFIHLLTYLGTLQKRKFYFAWEDTYSGSNGDFTDLVTSVAGVECGGAGQPCTTGGKGVCAGGVTTCDDGTLRCEPLGAGSSERCDGLDNDCNGVVDDGAQCDNPQEVCVNGECVPRCTLGQEFGCSDDTQCDPVAGVCIDVACKGVTCPPDQTCHAGHCGVACDGIVCPHGITCLNGACVDPCAGKSCSGGQVCVGGLCLPGCTACGGVSCSAPLACDATSGACVDPSCPMGCPAGQYCDSGACKDACDGAICPPKHQCVMGQCVPSSMTNGAGGNGGGGGGGSGGTGGNGGAGGGGCGCAAPARQRGGTTGAFFLVVLFGLGARRLRHMM